jgi:hypothetical protein
MASTAALIRYDLYSRIQSFRPTDLFTGQEPVSWYDNTALNDDTGGGSTYLPEDALTHMERLEERILSAQDMLVGLDELPAREIPEFDRVGLATRADLAGTQVNYWEVSTMDEKKAQ